MARDPVQTLRMPAEFRRQVEAVAGPNGFSRAVREALELWLARHERQQESREN